MSTCAQCGAENVEGAEFCAYCGSSLVQPGAAPGAPVQPPPATPYAAPPPGAPYQQPMPYRPAAPTTNGKATASLVLGIVGIFICPIICCVLALIFGYQARNEIAASGGYQTGESYATAGIILGWVGIVLAIVWITIWAVAVAVSSTSTLIIPMII
jgi:hypothetical protein